MKPFRTAAECIDWSLPCPSIFMTKAEAQAYFEETGRRINRPLKDKTLARIAAGLVRYVIQAKQPFIVRCNDGGEHFRGQSAAKPMCTLTASNDALGLVVPIVSPYYGAKGDTQSRASSVEEPLRTQTTENRHALVSAFLAKHYGGVVGHGVKQPVGTVTTVDHHAVVTAQLSGFIVSPAHSKTTGRGPNHWPATEPLRTQATTSDKYAVAAHLSHMYTSNTRGGEGDPRKPIKTITAGGNHAMLVAAFLQTYYGSGVNATLPGEPAATIRTHEALSLVTVIIEGETYIITDIGMRMLNPRELFLCQGFDAGYVIDHGIGAEGERVELTKTAQVRMCGNSVSPPAARAIVAANFRDERIAEVA